MSNQLIPMVDLKRQHDAIKPELDAALQRVVESGFYVNGPEVRAFEQEWAAYCGAGEAIGLGNGTAALNLTLRALGIGPGDEVVTVAFTLSATLDAIVDTGARPVLADVDPATYTLDPSLLEAAITPRTKAILPVHIYGHPADMDAILDIANRHGLPVVADACEAHGTLYKGRQVASMGTASCFSFYPTKNLGAMGDAGGVVTSDPALAERIRMLRIHGWDRRFHSAVSAQNSRMDEIHAAVLRAKLPHLDAWNQRKRAIARRFGKAISDPGSADGGGSEVGRAAPSNQSGAPPADRPLSGGWAPYPIIPASHADWADPCYYIYVVLSPYRDELRRHLTEAGIASDVHWPEPPHLQPAFESLGYGRGSLPVTERLCDEVLTIPMYPELSDAEVERICAALSAFVTR